MTDYVFEVMKQFPGAFINGDNELILIPKTNLYVCLHDVNTPTDLKFKLLEYCSRDCTSAMRYSQEWRNRRYQDDVLADLADKETPKKPIDIEFGPCGDLVPSCPTCKHEVVTISTYYGRKYYPRCPFCGQKLKGDDEDDC